MPAAGSHTRRTWPYIAAVIAITIASRIPQLASPHLLLDGDECIAGLMAKHLAEGRAFPVFFYGQTYGLALVEAPTAAAVYLVAGMGPLQLKLSMLALWIAGI